VARCVCSCGLVFGGVGGFDLHRAGSFEIRDRAGRLLQASTRRCLAEGELALAGLTQNAQGIWHRPPPREASFSPPPSVKKRILVRVARPPKRRRATG
jgi:hypothetical protein